MKDHFKGGEKQSEKITHWLQNSFKIQESIYEESLQVNQVYMEANPNLLLKETMYVSNKIWGVWFSWLKKIQFHRNKSSMIEVEKSVCAAQ